MAALHSALECLRPKEFHDIPVDDLQTFLPKLFLNAELIANSIPPPPNGTPYESAQRSRVDPTPATSAADLTQSEVRRPPPCKEHLDLQKAWGKPMKLGNKETATGMSVFKMAGHDRHGAWFARTSIHEGLGFAKWKRAMLREFPESLEVQGGPGEGNVRGIGGDQRLEDITVDGVGKLEGRTVADLRNAQLLTITSLPTFCPIPWTNVTPRVHHVTHHLRHVPHRCLKGWEQDSTSFHGSLNSSLSPRSATPSEHGPWFLRIN